jgi:hypothetical protein
MTLISQKFIDNHDIVARYLADKLSDAERESFEAYYLERPEMLQELNRTAQFKSGLMDLRERGELEKALIVQLRWNRSGSVALVASIAIVVIGAIFWFTQHGARPILAASITMLGSDLRSTVSPVDTYAIQRTRTSSYDATISSPSKPAAIELRIKPEVSATGAGYRVSLSTISANGVTNEIAGADNLQPAKDGFVAVYLNASNLSPAIYELKISSNVANETASSASSFLIELVSNSQVKQ